jgi:hypothetical protein
MCCSEDRETAHIRRKEETAHVEKTGSPDKKNRETVHEWNYVIDTP